MADDLAQPAEPRRLLYCENVFARYLTSLVESDPSVRYVRASDIGQAARSSLSRIYRDMGDLDAAEAQARACIELAPTSAPAYNDLITCFAEGDHYDRIIDVARDALRVAVTGNDIAYVYYRLAFAYWQTGRLPEALACYLRVPETSPMGEAALRERNDLVSEMGNNVPGSDWDPTACLRTAGVPLAPLGRRDGSGGPRAHRALSTPTCRWRPPPWRASWRAPSATTSCTPWPPASAKGCKHFLQQDAQEKAQYGPFLITLNLKSPGCAQGSQRGPRQVPVGPAASGVVRGRKLLTTHRTGSRCTSGRARRRARR